MMREHTLSNHIILIGMPTAGKSTVGKLLAKKLSAQFLDGDDYIAKKIGKRPQEIINERGEAYFLNIERELFYSPQFFQKDSIVFAPGGSVIYHDDLMKNLKNAGRIIFLDVPLEEIKRRLALSPPRGIIGLKTKTLRELYDERRPLYQKYADIIIPCAGLSKEGIMKQVIAGLSRLKI